MRATLTTDLESSTYKEKFVGKLIIIITDLHHHQTVVIG